MLKALQLQPNPKAHILRVIPSIGAKINDSVTLIAETALAGHEQQRLTEWIFNQLGQVQVSTSGPFLEIRQINTLPR